MNFNYLCIVFRVFSDGSGRVGIFSAIYIALERMELESLIDMFSIVRNLRTQRIGMVKHFVSGSD